MEVSRPTFQRILTAAREKVAEALIEGKALRFQGGDYSFKPRCPECGRDFASGEEKGGPQFSKKFCPDCEK
jgi:nucleoid DNA-binding protein